MGGFTNLIYFKNYLSEQSKSRIKETIKSYGEFELENDFDYEIRVESNGEDYPFRIYYSDAEQDEDFDSESKAEFEKKLGFIPKCYIGFMAWTNQKFGHKFIAELMLDILNIENGLVDFSCAIDPNYTDDREKIRKFISNIEGKIYELEYKTNDDRIWFWHIADKEFLKNWIEHKKFYIPK